MRGADRPLAWLITGPLGRLVAFMLDFAAALVGLARRRKGIRNGPPH